MSFDLYLLPLQPTDGIEAAVELCERLGSGDSDPRAAAIDVRTAADVLLDLDPRCSLFALKYSEIARFENITIDEAKRRYDYVELNGPEDGPSLAQFVFYASHVVVHWYSGTSEEEMFRYLAAICRHTGQTLIDPQSGQIHRLGRDGNFR